MISADKIYITSDNLIRVVGFRNAQTGAYINAADTAQMTLKDSDNANVTGAVDITLTPKSAGTLDAGAVVDMGDSTVKLPDTAHGYDVGDLLTIAGTTNYNGTYEVEDVGADWFTIEATYVAENVEAADTVTPCGIYEGTLIDTLSLTDAATYYLYITMVEGGVTLTIRKTWKAGYYTGD